MDARFDKLIEVTQRMNKEIHEMKIDVVELKTTINSYDLKDLNTLKVDVASLKTKSRIWGSVWGGLCGIIGSVGYMMIEHMTSGHK